MKEIKTAIIYLAAFLDTTLSDEQLKVYSDWISEKFNGDHVALAACIKIYIENEIVNRSPYEKFYSTLAKISEIQKPTRDFKSEAENIAENVLICVSKFGNSNAERAFEYLGDDAKVLKSIGGFSNLCRTLTPENRTFVKKSLVEAALGVLKNDNYLQNQSRISFEQIASRERLMLEEGNEF
jgi:hypothetical protein